MSPRGHSVTGTTAAGDGPVEIIAGRYRVVAMLGRGAMGEVLLANDPDLDRDVAIKRLHAEHADDAQIAERFRREGAVLARVRHPGVPQVFDRLQADGRPMIVMEYIPGDSLQDILRRRHRLEWWQCADVGWAVCSALDAASRQGVVHRDVKPANILVERSGGVKLVDFGVARMDEGGLSHTGMLIGTPRYLAPEQARGEGATETSDIYGVAATLFEAACGEPVFGPHLSRDQELLAHAADEARDPRELAPDLPDAAVDVLRRGLARDPGARFATAAQFADALAAARGPGDGPHRRGFVTLPPLRPSPPAPRAHAAPATTEAPGPHTTVPPGTPTTVPAGDATGPSAASPGGTVAGRTAVPDAATYLEPAAPSVAPGATPGSGRARTAALAVIAAVVAAGAGAAGIALTRDGPAPVGLRSEGRAGYALDVPSTWSVADDAPAGVAPLGLSEATYLRGPAADGLALSVGYTDATGPELLPGAFTRTLRGPRASARRVAVAGTTFLRRGPLRVTSARDRVWQVSVTPTRRGVLTVACSATAPATAAMRACGDAADRVALERRSDALPLMPDPAFAKDIAAAVSTFGSARRAAVRGLARASTRAAQARAAGTLAATYTRLAGRLADTPPGPQARNAHADLVARARDAATAYGGMASAARHGNAAAWAARSRAAAAAHERLQQALTALSRVGR